MLSAETPSRARSQLFSLCNSTKNVYFRLHNFNDATGIQIAILHYVPLAFSLKNAYSLFFYEISDR